MASNRTSLDALQLPSHDVPPKRSRLAPVTLSGQSSTPRSLFNSVNASRTGNAATRLEHLTIHSKDRNKDVFPNSNNFKIKLSDTCGPLKDIKSIKLVGGCLPDSQSMMSQPYLCLWIDELTRGEHIISTDSVMQKTYAILQPDRAIEQGSYFQLKADWFDFSHVKLNGDVNQLTISIRAADGSLYAFDNNADFHLFFVLEKGCDGGFE